MASKIQNLMIQRSDLEESPYPSTDQHGSLAAQKRSERVEIESPDQKTSQKISHTNSKILKNSSQQKQQKSPESIQSHLSSIESQKNGAKTSPEQPKTPKIDISNFGTLSEFLQQKASEMIRLLYQSFACLSYGVIKSHQILQNEKEVPNMFIQQKDKKKLIDWYSETEDVLKFHSRRVASYIGDLKFLVGFLTKDGKKSLEKLENEIIEVGGTPGFLKGTAKSFFSQILDLGILGDFGNFDTNLNSHSSSGGSIRAGLGVDYIEGATERLKISLESFQINETESAISSFSKDNHFGSISLEGLDSTFKPSQTLEQTSEDRMVKKNDRSVVLIDITEKQVNHGLVGAHRPPKAKRSRKKPAKFKQISVSSEIQKSKNLGNSGKKEHSEHMKSEGYGKKLNSGSSKKKTLNLTIEHSGSKRSGRSSSMDEDSDTSFGAAPLPSTSRNTEAAEEAPGIDLIPVRGTQKVFPIVNKLSSPRKFSRVSNGSQSNKVAPSGSEMGHLGQDDPKVEAPAGVDYLGVVDKGNAKNRKLSAKKSPIKALELKGGGFAAMAESGPAKTPRTRRRGKGDGNEVTPSPFGLHQPPKIPSIPGFPFNVDSGVLEEIPPNQNLNHMNVAELTDLSAGKISKQRENSFEVLSPLTRRKHTKRRPDSSSKKIDSGRLLETRRAPGQSPIHLDRSSRTVKSLIDEDTLKFSETCKKGTGYPINDSVCDHSANQDPRRPLMGVQNIEINTFDYSSSTKGRLSEERMRTQKKPRSRFVGSLVNSSLNLMKNGEVHQSASEANLRVVGQIGGDGGGGDGAGDGDCRLELSDFMNQTAVGLKTGVSGLANNEPILMEFGCAGENLGSTDSFRPENNTLETQELEKRPENFSGRNEETETINGLSKSSRAILGLPEQENTFSDQTDSENSAKNHNLVEDLDLDPELSLSQRMLQFLPKQRQKKAAKDLQMLQLKKNREKSENQTSKNSSDSDNFSSKNDSNQKAADKLVALKLQASDFVTNKEKILKINETGSGPSGRSNKCIPAGETICTPFCFSVSSPECHEKCQKGEKSEESKKSNLMNETGKFTNLIAEENQGAPETLKNESEAQKLEFIDKKFSKPKSENQADLDEGEDQNKEKEAPQPQSNSSGGGTKVVKPIVLETAKMTPFLAKSMHFHGNNNLSSSRMRSEPSLGDGSNFIEYLKDAFDEFKFRHIKVPELKGKKRIDVSQNGRYFYYGGEGGLSVLKKKSDRKNFKLISLKKDINYFGLRTTPSSHIILQELKTNNLVIYDKALNKKFSFEPKHKPEPHPATKPPSIPQGNNLNSTTSRFSSFGGASAPASKAVRYRQPHFSFEGEKMVWFGGKTSLYIIDLRTLSQVFIDNIIPEVSELPPEPLSVIADFKNDKLLIHFILEDENILVYLEQKNDPVIRLIEDVFPKFTEFECMDLDRDKRFGFVGGAVSSLDHSKGEMSCTAYIIAFSFDRSLGKVGESALPEEECSKVLCLRMFDYYEKGRAMERLREGEQAGDSVIFALTDGPLYVVCFDVEEKRFEVIRKIDVVGVDGIKTAYRDMCLIGNSTFLVSDEEHENHILQIKFKRWNRSERRDVSRKSRKRRAGNLKLLPENPPR